VCISWTIDCLILLMHSVTMKFLIVHLKLHDNREHDYSIGLKIPVDVCVCENLNVTNFLSLYNRVKNLVILITYILKGSDSGTLYLVSLGVWTLVSIWQCKQNRIFFESGPASILRSKHGEISIRYGRNVSR
jgi:hypothetical protein